MAPKSTINREWRERARILGARRAPLPPARFADGAAVDAAEDLADEEEKGVALVVDRVVVQY